MKTETKEPTAGHTPQAWHWPDHNIGKRESRRLRDEHNALYNSHYELAESLAELLKQATGPAQVYGDGRGNNGRKTGLSGAEFNSLRDSRILRAKTFLTRLNAK